jgi:hypothetical protein
MIGREFFKRLRLLNGRSETIKTRFELNSAGRLVEHIIVETHDMPTPVERRDQESTGLRTTPKT